LERMYLNLLLKLTEKFVRRVLSGGFCPAGFVRRILSVGIRPAGNSFCGKFVRQEIRPAVFVRFSLNVALLKDLSNKLKPGMKQKKYVENDVTLSKISK